MCEISIPDLDHHHVALLREWFVSEWGDVDPFNGSNEGIQTPSPLVATEDGKLQGGLSFCWARSPKTGEMKIWINAVLVSPAYRGLGLASKLVRAAENESARMGFEELFVYSKFPALYEKLGWQLQKSEDLSKVLWKPLANAGRHITCS